MTLQPHTGGRSFGLPGSSLGTVHPVHVLLIDDDDDEASLTRSLLACVDDLHYEVDWVSTFAEGRESIARAEHDAFLIDHNLGARKGTELVREARDAGSLAALIMLTGQNDRATDMAAMDAGATAFLLKGRPDSALLDRTLRYSISQAAMLSALNRSRSEMAALEELGRVLVKEGPTPATIGWVVELIADRFMLPQVAIYLAEGDTLHLAAQRGYDHPLLSVSKGDSSVQRVARARHPLFVASLSPEPGVRNSESSASTELSLPLLVRGDLVGLLNIASSATTPIGEEGYLAIRLVADRLTAALELTNERRVAEEQLSRCRRQLMGGYRPSTQLERPDAES